MEKDRSWTLDEVMAAIRAGQAIVCLVNGRLHYKTDRRDVALATAVKQHLDTLTKMLEYSDTRLCLDISSHAPQYRQATLWYTCPECAGTRADLAERHLRKQAVQQTRKTAQEAIV
jgi:hypothetical protein